MHGMGAITTISRCELIPAASELQGLVRAAALDDSWPGSGRRNGHGRLGQDMDMGQEEALIEGQSDKGFGIEQRGILDPPQGNKEALVAPAE